MRLKPLIVIALFASACGALHMPGFLGGGHAKTTETSSSSHSEEMHVNGRPVDLNDDDDRPAKNTRSTRVADADDRDDDRRARKRKPGPRSRDEGRDKGRDDSRDDDRADDRTKKTSKGDLGKTCHHNRECGDGNEACYVGSGDFGYCTKMCDSFSDCPMHWECTRAGNAPQKFCKQDAD